MPINRRRLLAFAAATAGSPLASAAVAAPAASPISKLGLDAAQFGLRPGSPDDQSRALQRAIEETARRRAAAGTRARQLSRRRADAAGRRAARRRARRDQARADRRPIAVHGRRRRPRHACRASCSTAASGRCPTGAASCSCENCRAIMIADCEITSAGGNGIALHAVDGEITDTRLTDIADVAIHSIDARGLLIARNTIAAPATTASRSGAAKAGDDGTIVIDNRIEIDRQPLRRLRPVRQRHQRVPRRQRDRARQPHPQLRVLGGARQRRLQHPDRRQQHQRRARGRALFRVRLRGRADRQQHGRRRGDRRLGDQFQRGRAAGGRAGQHHPQPRGRRGRPAPTPTTAPASASRSRPTPRSPAT